MKYNVCKILGENIKKYRKLKNFTQIELAEKINLEVKSLSLIETGKGFLSSKTLEKLAEVLNVSPNYLFTPLDSESSKSLYSEIHTNLDLIKNNSEKLQTVLMVVKSLV